MQKRQPVSYVRQTHTVAYLVQNRLHHKCGAQKVPPPAHARIFTKYSQAPQPEHLIRPRVSHPVCCCGREAEQQEIATQHRVVERTLLRPADTLHLMSHPSSPQTDLKPADFHIRTH